MTVARPGRLPLCYRVVPHLQGKLSVPHDDDLALQPRSTRSATLGIEGGAVAIFL